MASTPRRPACLLVAAMRVSMGDGALCLDEASAFSMSEVPMPDVIKVSDDSTRADIAEALRNLCQRARREMPVVGTAELPTPWDKRHHAIDELLDDYERAQ